LDSNDPDEASGEGKQAMKKAAIVLTAATVAWATAGAASAATLTADWQNPPITGSHDPDGVGGTGFQFTGFFEIGITSTAGLAITGGDLFLGSTFKSFCVEIGETLNDGSHAFNVSSQSILGGASSNEPQALLSETAFLYTQYRAGTLASLAGVGTFGENLADLNAFQDALWHFQNQLGNTPTSAKALAFIAAAEDAVDNGAYGWAGGLGNVRVLNVGGAVTGAGGEQYANGAAQDVLVLIPLPQGVGLASAGLLVLGIRRRRSL
jgi:hypothetical protein